ncbi:F-box/LRR-repeat protein At4g29420 [Ricinus communis]|uniref:F-box domain-containing protein n=1 Tax=Ricinus communis TaxID=3988 RepID=B9SW19_RICCO|nr:F-box/LRR-repeat protein At4g29420 [Ricinus communis]EEF32202.1 conserved hypothetical protein [Ricinus communis]|eukprot:XP_002530188.1 F-box/LRR-repeat protein At4g29420 [Ricinus communis]
MEHLPEPILLEILTRLTDSTELARCRLVSKTFNKLIFSDIRSINLTCTLSRYLKSRSPNTKDQITPFKRIFNRLVNRSDSLVVDSVTIGVEKSLCGITYDDVEEDEWSDDLYLSEVEFVKEWLLLPRVCRELKFLSISDFWIQACWRRSQILALVSSCCHGLLELEVKNSWLSVDGLIPMPVLTSLTLESIRLDDENLSKVNHCFPCLKVLNLVGVGGLREPKIHLYHLRTCRWTVSNAPNSLSIFAPNLLKLELNCIEPRSLILETPLLSDFYLSIRKANKFKVKQLHDLKILQLESTDILSLIRLFPSNSSVERLTVDSPKYAIQTDEMIRLNLEMLFDVFMNVSSLTLLSAAWSDMEKCFLTNGLRHDMEMKELKEVIVQLVIQDIDVTLSFIFTILDKCTNLSDVGLLIHCEVDPNVASSLLSRCKADHPRIRWRWGMWKEGSKGTWISDGIYPAT